MLGSYEQALRGLKEYSYINGCLLKPHANITVILFKYIFQLSITK